MKCLVPANWGTDVIIRPLAVSGLDLPVDKSPKEARGQADQVISVWAQGSMWRTAGLMSPGSP